MNDAVARQRHFPRTRGELEHNRHRHFHIFLCAGKWKEGRGKEKGSRQMGGSMLEVRLLYFKKALKKNSYKQDKHYNYGNCYIL